MTVFVASLSCRCNFIQPIILLYQFIYTSYFHNRHKALSLINMSADFVFRETSGKVSIEWLIKDFCSLPKTRDFILNSPSFLVSDAKWYIRMYPNELMQVLIGLGRKCPLTGCHHISYEFKFKHEDELLVSSQLQEYEFKTNSNKSPMTPMYKVRIINLREFSQPNFNLTVLCNVHFKDMDSLRITKGSETLNKNAAPKMTKGIEILLQNLKDLCISGHQSDVTIKVEDREFRAHRSILVARSPVFASMFHHDMMEKTSGLINIEDCDPEAFKDFLLYVYTGKFDDVSSGDVAKLYMIASKYDLQELRDDCIQFMRHNMTADSFCDVVVIASMYNASELMESVADFFTHNFKQIFRAAKWQSFFWEYPGLASELFQKVSKINVK